MKKTLISRLLIILGLTIIFISSYDILRTKSKQNENLDRAIDSINSSNGYYSVDELYTFTPTKGEIIGILKIPRIDIKVPIVEGTSEKELSKGVGHYTGTGFPGQKKQIVFSGHRDTVFNKLGVLELGDKIEVQMLYGDFNYEIVEIFIVDADDKTVIDYTLTEEVLKITTCYPFNFIGSAPKRYIIKAK